MSLTVAIQYPSLGPHHRPRLEAIAAAAPAGAQVVAMEMFRQDSDYQWTSPSEQGPHFRRHTVMECASATGRRHGRALRRAVSSALDAVNPDLVVVNGWGHRESRFSLDWLRRRDRAWVLLTDSSEHDRRRHWPLEAYKRWLLRGCRAAFAAGSPQARYAARLGVPADAIFHPGSCVVDNQSWAAAADSARAEPATRRERLGLPNRYFLAVARFIPEKNLPFLVAAFARFRALLPSSPCHLVLCGAGPEEGRIRAEVVRHRLDDRVQFAGFHPPEELAAFYAFASCLVLPSRCERWGLVVNEAMACGLPVLVSRRCGAAEDLVQEGENGYAVSPNEPDRLGELLALLDRDQALCRRMGEASRRVVAGHSLEVGAANLWRAVAMACPAGGERR